jgi:hypothetical protein
MREEYENWEDSIRHTFIEMASYMDKNANPLDSIIDYAWSSGADLFFVNNAKDELRKLREEVDNLHKQLDKPVAWARINKRGDLYDPRLCLNPYINTQEVVPLYAYRKGHHNET